MMSDETANFDERQVQKRTMILLGLTFLLPILLTLIAVYVLL
jgi:hypothetical protein